MYFIFANFVTRLPGHKNKITKMWLLATCMLIRCERDCKIKIATFFKKPQNHTILTHAKIVELRYQHNCDFSLLIMQVTNFPHAHDMCYRALPMHTKLSMYSHNTRKHTVPSRVLLAHCCENNIRVPILMGAYFPCVLTISNFQQLTASFTIHTVLSEHPSSILKSYTES